MRRRVWTLAGVLVFWMGIPKPPLREGLSLSQAVYDRSGRLLRLSLTADQSYRLWLPLAALSPAVAEAALLQEDRWFRYHPGINPVSLARASWLTYIRGGRRVGGSTITMQVARMRYKIRSRTPGGKLLQIVRALQLELKYSKNDILEAYLNLIPMGGNVEGVGAAALIYFGKDAGRLSVPEAVALSVIPKSPAERSPLRGGGATSVSVRAARLAAFARWVRRHPQDAGRAAEVVAVSARPSSRAFLPEPGVAGSGVPLPLRTGSGRAPHFAEAAARDNPDLSVIHTTLDPGLQALVERKARAYVEARRGVGIRNAAAMIVDYRTMEVLASLGSADYFDAAIQGQVNGARAKRSPGSALKPFIYALGMEQGVIHPLTMLKDAPTGFGGYNPENFDRDFLGPVSARDGLIRSRNVPAVQIAGKLSTPSLHGFLKQAGVAGLRSEEHYGLSLVLGSAEMTMEELVRLYAMLANGGVLKPLRTRPEDPSSEGERLLSEDASFMVLDILKDAPRPGQAWRQDWTRDPMPVYWKTGTSYGFRDAWSIGIVGPYVVAVWIGNFNGEGNPAFVGIEAAAPLMFRIVDALRGRAADPGKATAWAPRNVVKVKVCALSGRLPGPDCPHAVKTWFIPGVSPIQMCDIHRAVLVDARTGGKACKEGPMTKTEVYEYWPSDLLKIFRRAGIPRRSPPGEGADCGGLDAQAAWGLPPQITSPPAGVQVALRAATAGKETMALAAVTDADARELHWFAGGRYLGRSAAGRPFFWTPTPGRIMVRAVDDHGRSDAREVVVTVTR